MNLWIRSQDRTFLRKVNTIGIVEGRDFWSIDENLTVSFGKYKTKERAIEVLDEIQDELISSDFMPIEKNEEVLTCGSARIYEMPEDWGKDWYYV